MADLILKNCLVDGNITDITVENGKITEVAKTDRDGEDMGGMRVYPGLVDIHTHGMIGYDTMDGDKLSEMSEYLLKNGITSWLPTTMTVAFDDIARVVNATIPQKGANILGFHMEGPYISPKHKGAQNEKYIKNPSVEEFSKLKNVKMVTIAPELSGSLDFIKKCGAVVSLGHTDCTYDEAIAAIDAGAMCLTHTFNAMPPLHHRAPAAIGAAFDKRAYAQVICDGLHIHPSVIRILYRLFGKERMVLISDSMRATGMPDGKYEFGGQEITVENHIARAPDGAIAGSTSTLMTCVKKAIEFGIPESDAFYMASRTPCELMGFNKGKIEKGYDADLIVLDDKLELSATVLGGRLQKL